MISPEAARREGKKRRIPSKGKQEAMHFKYSAKFSEEIDEGPRRSALKAHYSPETNSGCSSFLYLYLHFLPGDMFITAAFCFSPSSCGSIRCAA